MPANIWAITQTSDGYLWLGSVDGLYRFDGVRVERIAADKLPSPSVHALAASPSGGVWVGYERPVGVISLLRNGKVVNFPVIAPSTTSVHQIIIGPDKSVWASTADSILRFDGKKFSAVVSDWGSSFGEGPGGVWYFGVASDKTVWSKNLNGLFYLRKGSSRFERASWLAGGREGFSTAADGTLWTADSQSRALYSLAPLSNARSQAVQASERPIKLTQMLQGPILLDRDDTLWCVSFSDGGLYRMQVRSRLSAIPGFAEHSDRFSSPNGLSSNLVRSLFEDREGNVWVGTSLGLDRFRASNIVTETNIPSGYRARFIRSAPDALFAYTGWSNTRDRETDGSESIYRILPHQKPELFVRNVGRLRGMDYDSTTRTLWLTTQKGVQPLRGNQLLAPIELPIGVVGTTVFSAAHDASGALWISSYGHGVFRREGGKWVPIAVRSTLGATAVLVPDPSGDMWIRYSGGTLFRMSGHQIKDFSQNELNIGDITFMQAHGRGMIVGGEFGLGKIQDGRFHSIHSSSFPALTGVTGITETAGGSRWIFTQAGILRASTKLLELALQTSNSRDLRLELLDSRDGLPGAPYGAIYGHTAATDSSNRAWFTTGNGLVWIDPNNLHHNTVVPNVVIHSIATNGKTYFPSQDVTLPTGVSNIEIDYSATSLTMPDRVHFRYKLEGVDRDWVDAGNRRQAFYTTLGAGSFKFRVIAANNDGVWNRDGATIEFSVPPTFLQSIWFKILLGITALGTLYAAYRWRVHMASDLVRLQMEERLAERDRIARDLHDTLLQGVQGLMLRFQVVADHASKDEKLRCALEGALDRADQVLIEGRNRVTELRGDNPQRKIDELLHREARSIFEGSEIKYQISVVGQSREMRPEACDELTTIAREAMFNALRHAAAGRIDVILVFKRRQLELRISDDGVGMDASAAAKQRPGHFGLTGMGERAAKIHGRMTISSHLGGGTLIKVLLPAKNAYAARPRHRSIYVLLFGR